MRNFPNAVRAGAVSADEAPPYRGASAISGQAGEVSALRKRPKQLFALTLRPLESGWPFPPEHRLRAALKVLLRRYGLRCVRCQPTPPTEVFEPKG